MKHVYCIEGADNVGKSTLIANMKKEEYCSHYPYKRVVFKKFPTNNVEVYTDINKMNNILFICSLLLPKFCQILNSKKIISAIINIWQFVFRTMEITIVKHPAIAYIILLSSSNLSRQ